MKQIGLQIDLQANQERVWNKWTTKEGLLSFFPADCKIELRIGGAFEMYFNMEAPEGERGSEDCKILSYIPGQMLSFSWNAPPHLPNVRSERTWVVLRFDAKDEGHTSLWLDHLGWQEGEDWDEAYAYFEAAWTRVLKNLAEQLKTEKV